MGRRRRRRRVTVVVAAAVTASTGHHSHLQPLRTPPSETITNSCSRTSTARVISRTCYVHTEPAEHLSEANERAAWMCAPSAGNPYSGPAPWLTLPVTPAILLLPPSDVAPVTVSIIEQLQRHLCVWYNFAAVLRSPRQRTVNGVLR